MNCKVCNSDFTDEILVTEKTSHYMYCNDCLCVSLKDYNDLENVYDEEYVNNLNLEVLYGNLFSYYKDTIFFNTLKRDSFLEIGFANIGVLKEAKKHFNTVHGLDIVIPNKEKLEQEGITPFEENILEFENTMKYDVIWLSHVIEHFTLEDAKKILGKIYNMLNDDGVVYFGAPNAELYKTKRFGFVFSDCKPKEHAILYSEREFNKIARESGFRRTCLQIYDGPMKEFEFSSKAEWRMLFKKKEV